MSSVKIKLNTSYLRVRELLRSSELQEECVSYAKQIQATAGEHFAVESRSYPERRGAAVYPADDVGYYDNLKNNTLVKAMSAAKGK